MRRRPLSGAVTSLANLPDRLLASDPGLVRLTLAVRGTVSVFLTSCVALTVAHFLGVSMLAFATGVCFSMIAPFLTREPTLRQRQRSMVLLTLPAAFAAVGTTLLHQFGPVGDTFFLLLVFLSFLLHPRDPRAIGYGLIAVVMTYVGLYLKLPIDTLPTQMLGIVIALPLTALACFVLVPVNPAATLRRAVRAVQWRAARVLHSTLESASGPGPGSGGSGPGVATARLRRDLMRLSEAALIADDQIELLQPVGREAVRAGLMDIELATARLSDLLLQEAPSPRQTARLMLHERRVRRGRRYAMQPEHLEPGTLRAGLVELGRAAHALGTAAAAMRSATVPPAASSMPPGPFGWRIAIRVTFAAGLAMAGGMALSPQRWFWAVLTVYVVFLNARSRGDTIYKGIQRLCGTLLGIVGGIVLAMFLTGHIWLQAAGLLLAIFGMYYLYMVSYTVAIFCVTVMLGLIYGMLGASLDELLALRLEETAIGAVAAVFVAACVLPTRTRDQVMRSGGNVLAALAAAVRSSREALTGGGVGAPASAMRLVDRQVMDLRLALAPLTARRAVFRRTRLERPVPALFECVHWARVLAASCQDHAPPAAEASLLAARAEQIERRLAAMAGQNAPDLVVSDAPAVPASADAMEVGAALDRLDAAVDVLAERLRIGVLEGFALDA